MKVLVTGGTGFVGAHSAAAIQGAGHDVRFLVRDAPKSHRVGAAVGLRTDDLVVGDVTDREAVEKALVGCDGVLHAAAAVSLDRRRAGEVMATNATGARNVLVAAAERGLERIVHVSSTSALATVDGLPLSTASPVSTGPGYAASKAATEEVARGLQADGVSVHITYPAGVIGPAAGESLGETSAAMARFVAGGVLPTSAAAISIIDVRDLAEIHRLLFDGVQRPARVMCGGVCLSMHELGTQLSALTGRRFPVLPVPPRAWRAAGWVADRLTSVVPMQLPITEESMSLITSWTGTDDNAPSALGLRYRPVASTLTAAIGAWVGAGLLSSRHAGRLVRA